MKSVWFLSFRNFSGDIFGTLGTVFSVTGPTLTKKSLKLFVIAVGSSMIDPLTMSWDMEKLVLDLTLTSLRIPSHVFFYIGGVSIEVCLVILTFRFLCFPTHTISYLIVEFTDSRVVGLPLFPSKKLVTNTY